MTFLILAAMIACISRTVTQEEIFREVREFAKAKIAAAKTILGRKVYYPLTCEYCFSHWATLLTLIIFKYHLAYNDARGYITAFFSLVAMSNVFLAVFEYLKILIKERRSVMLINEKLQTQRDFIYEKQQEAINANHHLVPAHDHIDAAHLN